MKVRVWLRVEGIFSQGSDYFFEYKWEGTPFLTQMIHSGTVGSVLLMNSLAEPRYPKEFRLMIGEQQCNMFLLHGETQVDDSMIDEPWKYRHRDCGVMNQAAGYYRATFYIEEDLLLAAGDNAAYRGLGIVHPWFEARVTTQNSLGEEYEYALSPRVDSVSPSAGGLGGGTLLTIHGAGFDASGSMRNKVTIGGAPCAVVSNSQYMLVCETGAYNTSSTSPASGGHGLAGTEMRVWKVPLPKNGRSSKSIFTTVDMETPDSSEVWSGGLEWSDFLVNGTVRWTDDDRTLMHLRGQFVAPHTANYTFYGSANDFAELWLGGQPTSEHSGCKAE